MFLSPVGEFRPIRCVCFVLFVNSLLLASSVHAQEKGLDQQRVLVVNATPAREAARETLWNVRDAIGSMDGLENIDLFSLLDGDDSFGVDASLDALKAGQRAFDEFDFSVAEDSLRQAFQGLAGWSQYRSNAVQAGIFLARTYAAQGKKKYRDRTWARVLALDPRVKLNDHNLSPTFRQSLDNARRIHQSRQFRRLTIQSPKRVPAAVFLNGRYLGMTPVRNVQIDGSDHHLRISADGYRHLSKFIQVKRRLTIKFQPVKSERFALFRTIQSKLPQEYERGEMTGFLLELKALAMSDQAIVISSRETEVSAALLDLSRRRVASTARVDLSMDLRIRGRELVDRLYAGLDRNAPARPAAPMDTGVSVENNDINWFLWGSVGAATLAAIIIPIMLWPDAEEGIPTRSGTGAVLLRF